MWLFGKKKSPDNQKEEVQNHNAFDFNLFSDYILKEKEVSILKFLIPLDHCGKEYTRRQVPHLDTGLRVVCKSGLSPGYCRI